MIHALGLAAVFGAWLLPGHRYFWPSFQQEALAAAGVAVIALQAALHRALTAFPEWLLRSAERPRLPLVLRLCRGPREPPLSLFPE